jgi:hypothetical protein
MTNITELAESFRQWKFVTPQPPTLVLPKEKFEAFPERNFSLKNDDAKKYLQYESQTFGINLGWTDNAEPATAEKVAKFFLNRPGTDSSPVMYGELVAIAWGGAKPPYIRYEHRTIGVNLGWSESPVFEWKILGGKIGTPVRTREVFALYNIKSEGGEFLINFDRSLGGDLGWPSSQTYEDRIKEMASDLAKKKVKEFFGI